MKITKEQQIEAILDYFDFERVKKAMDALDWTWAFTDGVPEIGDLRRQARNLLTTIKNKPGESISTGGLKASCSIEHALELEFVVSSFSSYDKFYEFRVTFEE